jgi:phosphate transport system substrate-binding protein
MKSFKAICLATSIVIYSILMTGCNSSNTQQQTSLSIDGSTSMERVIGYLSEAYTLDNPDVKVSYNPTGSSAGIQSVLNGSCEVGLSSRELTETERETLNETVLAIDGIALVVSTDNPIDNLTIEQLTQIYTGNITNWQDVGGNDLPIVCIGREASSGTRDGFESIINAVDSCYYTQELTSTGDIVQTVATNENAIGYVSLASIGDSVKTLSIDGVAPTNDTILDGTYPVQRNFIVVTPKDRELSETATKFLDFITSTQAESYILKAGGVPVGNLGD